MRRLVDGHEPTGVVGSAEWQLHDSYRYYEHELVAYLSLPCWYKDNRSGR